MPVDELRELQLKQLKMRVYKLYTFSSFYCQKMKDAGVTPEDVESYLVHLYPLGNRNCQLKI
jgi:phenylacetate-coenzyme A ligase PaaK-like adenylate-forming protein